MSKRAKSEDKGERAFSELSQNERLDLIGEFVDKLRSGPKLSIKDLKDKGRRW